MSPYKAVIFDVGGVVCRSPLAAIAAYERENDIPENYINISITQHGSKGAWQQFERGEIDLWSFYSAFSHQLSDTKRGNVWYADYCKRHGIACPKLPDTLNIDGREVFVSMMQQAGEFDPPVVEAIHRLRASGNYRIIALTNNYSAADASRLPEPPADFKQRYISFVSADAEMKALGWDQGAAPPRLRSLFDDFCDSSVMGMRKPEPEFYLLACKRNKVNPNECVFLDDLRMNLKPAKELGMQTIHVPIGGSLEAMKQLEEVLKLDLTSDISVANSVVAKL